MAKARGTEAKLTRLRALRSAPATIESTEELRRALDDPSNVIIAEAAEVIGLNQVRDLVPELVATFDRLMEDPEKSDKQCRSKIAIVKALNELEFAEAELFLRGIVHVQDPVWNTSPREDAAGTLRALCALGLARLNDPDRLFPLTDLLLDSDKTARAGAARALGASGALAVVPLLRYKAQVGDLSPQVVGECLEGLLTLAPSQSLPFVARYLDNPDPALQEAAVFALAEQRRPEALSVLIDFWPRVPKQLEEAVLLAISTFRLPAAFDFLIAMVKSPGPQARAALAALAIHRHYPKLKGAIGTAVKTNGSADIEAMFLRKFRED